ncbi:Fatty acid-binding protein, intestinal [Lemmus lemmus]
MAFDGSWKVDRSENYEKFMEKMGINVVKRKVAVHDNLKLTITQEGNKFTVKESSTFRNIDIVFELGVSFTYSLADGTELSVRLFSFLFFFLINNAFLIFFNQCKVLYLVVQLMQIHSFIEEVNKICSYFILHTLVNV